MSAPDPKVGALTEAEREMLFASLNITGPMRHIFGDETADALEVLLDQEWENAETTVEQIVAARVAAVAEPVLALADWCATKGPVIQAVGVMIRRRVESTDAPAALARIKAEALRGAARAGRGFLGDEGHSSSAWDYLDMTADRIEAEAGDPS